MHKQIIEKAICSAHRAEVLSYCSVRKSRRSSFLSIINEQSIRRGVFKINICSEVNFYWSVQMKLSCLSSNNLQSISEEVVNHIQDRIEQINFAFLLLVEKVLVSIGGKLQLEVEFLLFYFPFFQRDESFIKDLFSVLLF